VSAPADDQSETLKFTGVSEGGMTDVMGEASGLNQAPE
jgi:hypothetical protein